MNVYTSNYSYYINGDIRFYVQFFRTSATFLPVIFKNASYNIVQYEQTTSWMSDYLAVKPSAIGQPT